MREVERFDSYLGLSTLVGQAKYQTFSFLKDRVWKKIQGWKGQLLSRAGKEILIKAVVQSILTYTMGVFQLPVKLCDELNAMCARFWWGQISNERKIHWKSWKVLTKPKNEGGMGFRDLRNFNLAMLAKQGWRLLHEKDSLLYGCFKAKYFPRSCFLEAVDIPNNSYVWKSLLVAKHILKKGCCWRVGDGRSIRVMQDKWIPNYDANQVFHWPLDAEEDWPVSELMDGDGFGWDHGLIGVKFHREDAEAILCIPLSRRNIPDSIVWLPNKDGEYTLRLGHFTARELDNEKDGRVESSGLRNREQIWPKLWKLYLPSKIKVFGWRACQDILSIKENLAHAELLKMGCANSISKKQSRCCTFCGVVGWLGECGLTVADRYRSVWGGGDKLILYSWWRS